MTRTPAATTDNVRYISLRWRILLPVFAIVLVVTLLAAYLLTRGLTGDSEAVRSSLLTSNTQAVVNRLSTFINEQRDAAAGLLRIPEGRASFDSGDASRLNTAIANYISLAGLDGLAVERDGSVVGTTLENAFFTEVSLDGGATAIVSISRERLLDVAQGGSAVAVRLETTADDGDSPVATGDAFAAENAAIALGSPVNRVTLGTVDYLATRASVNGFDITVYMQADPPIASEASQQLVAVTLAIVASGVVASTVLIVTLILERVNRVRIVIERLAAGEVSEPTGMRPTDEIGALGYALDRYASRVQEKQDEMRSSLRRQRRELEHFNAMIESVPDGVIVQDIDGNVTFINDRARQLIGERYNFFRRASERDITAAVAETLGGMTAPGIIAKGSPQRIEIDDRVLSVQSAAIQSLAEKQIGTVMVVRDVTTDARREQARAALLDQITFELEDESLSAPQSDGTAAFAQEARRREVALGKLLVELRELTTVDSQVIRKSQRSISLEMLVHAAANEWRAIASAANLTLDVIIEQTGLMVSGDERRLRWAIGNILDNAIKYTPPGGRLALEVKGTEGGYARLRVRDNGAGISPDDLPRVFDRFYRGSALAASGRVIQVPGTGLGLPIAREIIEAHGGLITVRSTPGIGTAVYFTLPLEGTPLPATPLSPDDEADEEAEPARYRM